ncbi:hypothetical protein [Streptomyces apricus]|uniref:hypothetical protein n=1 Tax=Streptomyces apricus TaxID=1828112 RepID=UPI001F413B3A|nr:hypothetical protein [Streptomyces apricus]
MDLSFYKSFIFEEARDQGRDQGRNQGEVRRGAQDILDVFEVRGINVPEAVRERIISCDDPEVLRQWHRRAVVVGVAEDVFVGG